jgi:osmotically-inducible protein OsmY
MAYTLNMVEALYQQTEMVMTVTGENKKQDIMDNLIWDDSIDANDVVVEVQDGVATLEGTVPSYSAKVAAENDAFMVPGVLEVQNNLEIAAPAGLNLPNDEEITTNIKNKLSSTSQLNPGKIVVDTDGGIVHLSGVVNTFWELNRAEEIALSTKGVLGITNDLVVRISTNVTDKEIEEDIGEAIRRSAFIEEHALLVDVTNGVVTLSGTAPDYNTRSRAYNIAMYTKGVADVINDIRIG